MTNQEILNKYGFSNINANSLQRKTLKPQRKPITKIYKEYIDESEKGYSHYTSKNYWGYLGKVEKQPIVEEIYLEELADYIKDKHLKLVNKVNTDL